ncbi:MAG: hypothetical protein AAFR21_07205 [Pseudomonadota bacterium]
MDKRISTIVASAILSVIASTAQAGGADVLAVDAKRQRGDLWRFSVTVEHEDEGWDHYADKWEVLDADGNVLATRVLAHPHENEQPFTRSMSGIEIDPSIAVVTVRAHDSVHGYGGATVDVTLER